MIPGQEAILTSIEYGQHPDFAAAEDGPLNAQPLLTFPIKWLKTNKKKKRMTASSEYLLHSALFVTAIIVHPSIIRVFTGKICISLT